MNGKNDTLAEATNQTMSHSEIYAVIGILSVFTVTGTIGNALAFYVFFNLKNKLTSTIFILALAGVDFITCLVTIPYTMAVEYVDYHVKYDAVCKIYHFLITTTIPFSAFIMVAIAVDRYLCICHPFLHLMTIKRARIIVGCLSAFALSLGAIACVHYSVFKTREVSIMDIYNATDGALSNVDTGIRGNRGNSTPDNVFGVRKPSVPGGIFAENTTPMNLSTKRRLLRNTNRVDPFVKEVHTGQCSTINDVIDQTFFEIYQKMYSAFFVICCLVVAVLYSLIYRSVISQRRKRLRVQTKKCCLMWDTTSVECEQSEVTVALELNHSTTNGEGLKTRPEENNAPEVYQSSGQSSSRSRLERMRMANIKTAAMLFVVTLVFIVAFTPAWLMVHKFLKENLVFFYMYFIYNVANPIIYAFMNNTFRVELKKIFHCES